MEVAGCARLYSADGVAIVSSTTRARNRALTGVSICSAAVSVNTGNDLSHRLELAPVLFLVVLNL